MLPNAHLIFEILFAAGLPMVTHLSFALADRQGLDQLLGSARSLSWQHMLGTPGCKKLDQKPPRSSGYDVQVDLDYLVLMEREARYRGIPLVNLFERLENLLNTSLLIVLEVEQLKRLLVSRAMFVGIAGAAAHFYLTIATEPSEDVFRTGTNLFFGFSCCALVVRLWSRCLPADWFWWDGLTCEAKWWLEAMSCQISPKKIEDPSELRDLFESLQVIELRRGISASGQKVLGLDWWTRAKHQRIKSRLREVVDWFPLVELVGFGLPAFLLLVDFSHISYGIFW